MSPREQISRRMIAILKATGDFTAIKGWIVGQVFRLPIQQHQALCEINIRYENDRSNQTGIVNRTYGGEIIFTFIAPEVVTFDVDDIAISTGQVTIQDWIDACVVELTKPDRHTLNALTLDNGGRVQMIRLVGNIEYTPMERSNSFVYVGVIPFEIETEQPS